MSGQIAEPKGGTFFFFVFLATCAGLFAGIQAAEYKIRHQFVTGQARVITYTVPGQGECRAVLVDGARRGEVCEGEQ